MQGHGLQVTLTETRDSLSGFRAAVGRVKGWRARVDLANEKVSARIEKFVNSLEYLLASISRASEIIDEKLMSDDAEGESS